MYCGHSGHNILFVSNEPIQSSQLNVIPVPESLASLPHETLIRDYQVWRDQIVPKGYVRPVNQLRVAFVGVYGIDCGISTYSGWLFPEIIKHIGEYRIFAEHLSSPIEENPSIDRCWRRGEALTDLIHHIYAYDPDVVLVQHEYGIFPSARHWIAFITKMHRYKTIVTLHSVFRHKDKTVCEAAIPEIAVHTELGQQILVDEKKVPGKVHVIPHGSLPVSNSEKYWNIYHTKKTLVQFGFGFRYKGWEQSLDAVAKLKDTHPEVFFTGLFSESTFSKTQHQCYYNDLETRVNTLAIEPYVGIIRGYVHHQILEAYLRTNGIAIFPYIENGVHTVFGCSGAARIAMHHNIPTIVSQAPLFHDLEGVCPRINSVNELCQEIEMIWADPLRRDEHLKRQQEFLERTSWANMALKYIGIMQTP